MLSTRGDASEGFVVAQGTPHEEILGQDVQKQLLHPACEKSLTKTGNSAIGTGVGITAIIPEPERSRSDLE